MKKQVHTGILPSKENFKFNPKCWLYTKPKKALWTSTLYEKDKQYKFDDYMGKNQTVVSDWEDYIKRDYAEFYNEGKRKGSKSYILTPSNDARILYFNQQGFLNGDYRKYLIPIKGMDGNNTPLFNIDYNELSKDYDAVHFAYYDGVESVYCTMVYGLNCECTVWFRWVFDSVEEYKEDL